MPDLLDEALLLHRLLARSLETAAELRLKIEHLEHEVERLRITTPNGRAIEAVKRLIQSQTLSASEMYFAKRALDALQEPRS